MIEYIFWKENIYILISITSEFVTKVHFRVNHYWLPATPMMEILFYFLGKSLKLFIAFNLQIDGLVQDRRISIANAQELHLSCTNPSICFYKYIGCYDICRYINDQVWVALVFSYILTETKHFLACCLAFTLLFLQIYSVTAHKQSIILTDLLDQS